MIVSGLRAYRFHTSSLERTLLSDLASGGSEGGALREAGYKKI